jgi:pyruvate formate lyase activating enzyme
VPLGEVDAYLAQNRGWIDGVVITGGEPTLQPGLFDLIDHLIEQGLKVKLFTNGSQPDILRELIRTGRLAAISMDLKGPLDERYERAAGVSVDLDAIRASADVLMNDGIPYEFRTTVCPGLLTHDDVVDTARAVRGAGLLTLQQFRPVDCLDPAFEKIAPYGEDELDRMAEAASEFVGRCTVVK